MAKKYYIETYGCQMNVADSEVVASILGDAGYSAVKDIKQADLILVNTCSIRENAEQRVWGRLDLFRSEKRKRPQVIVGVLGCMAERLKEKLLESDKMVDMVVGPDAYRDLPMLVETAGAGHAAVNVLLSREETYADISPVRLESNGVSAFISIMRGCNNMCAYCVVPYVRGAERSRDPETIVRETREAFDMGYREVTLLGQNVNSYLWKGIESNSNHELLLKEKAHPNRIENPVHERRITPRVADSTGSESNSLDNSSETIAGGFLSTPDRPAATGFAALLEMVAKVDPRLRVRFSTSHPKDLSDDVLEVMAKHNNICKHIHLPVQSGSTTVLERMNRKYTRDWYLGRIAAINRILPGCTLSTDIIAGFCGETEEEHRETLSLMKEVGFDFAYMFKYSERPDTKAARHMKDDVPEEVKTRRLNEIIALQNELSAVSKKADIGKTFEVLGEGRARKSMAEPDSAEIPDNGKPQKRISDVDSSGDDSTGKAIIGEAGQPHLPTMMGRTTGNKVVVFQAESIRPGNYVNVTITRSTSATLIGNIVHQ
jgi:tRNA-2-methylthio-N6-dimethylallyladenosine synthase